MMFFKKVQQGNIDNSQQIKNTYGYQQFYAVSSFITACDSIRSKLLPDQKVISLHENNNFDEALAKAIQTSIANNSNAIYLSISLTGNKKTFRLGSQLSALDTFPLEKEYCPELSDDELEEKNIQRKILAKQLKIEVETERNKFKNFKFKHQFEIDAFKQIGMDISVTHNVIVKIDHTHQVIFYKDPYGRDIPEFLEQSFKSQLNGYTLCADKTQQQHPEDHSNCSIFGTLNLQTLVNHNSKNLPNYVAMEENEYISFIENKKLELAALVGLVGIEDEENDNNTEWSFCSMI